jgi:hypothetical protein
MRRLWKLLLPACLIAAAASATGAVEPGTLESSVKAIYLYKFGEFVQWPASAFAAADSPVNLCIAGQDPFGSVLDDAVAGRRIGGHPIVLHRLAAVAATSDCQILFIGAADARQAEQWMAAARTAHALTVTDSAAAKASGIVNFVMRDNHVRFEIDNDSAVASGLVISSKLLSLAQTTHAHENGD